MKTVITTYKSPDIIQRTSPVYDNVIQDAKRVLFYYPGGGTTLSLCLNDRETVSLFVPPFSNIKSADAADLVRSLSVDILAEADLCGIESGKDFLFNTHTKKIILSKDFIDFIPVYSTKGCLFVLEQEDGTIESCFRYVGDQTDSGILQFLALVIAKSDIAPPMNGLWTNDGKALLSFLVAERCSKAYEFKTLNGPWSSVAYSTRVNKGYVPVYDQSHYRLDKAREIVAARIKGFGVAKPRSLQEAMDLDDYKDYLDSSASSTKDEGQILLSDLVAIGVDGFTTGGYGLIEVNIDVSADVYQKIVIDGESGICFVTLAKGVHKPIEQIKDELNADNVEIVGDLTTGGSQ